jgi:hypothetical protein
MISLHYLAKKFEYEKTHKKPSIPSKEEKPIMGLTSEKNYIVANAVSNILAGTIMHNLVVPKNVKAEPKKYVEKKDYGKVPGYLTKHKNEIEE